MLFPDDFEHKIGFDTIRTLLRERCTFPLSREEADEVHFLTSLHHIQPLLEEGQEVVHILEDATFSFPRPEMHDMRDALSRIRIEGLFLDEEELSMLRKMLDAVLQYTTFFSSLPLERFPRMASLVSDASVMVMLAKELDRILDKYGRLKDNASPELSRIRHELSLSQGSVSRALNAILRKAQAEGMVSQDVTPTLREGRLVIPVSPAYKRKLGGIVHDESATGKTVYVEPREVVEANNRIRELESEERRERVRILQEFASFLRPYTQQLLASQRYLGHVDFLHAKALLARELHAIAPHLSDAPLIHWQGARHPLLYLHLLKQGKAVVPLNIELTEENHILIISGPNAGGKSVCLKTTVLVQYMLQCGLLVPVGEETTMGLFENLFIDIGDEQSIDDDLSTYSSHLRNMKHFVRYANRQTLFLIDEFGGGTEPQLGGALAEAVLMRLNDAGAKGVITTHYTNLKHFAEKHDGAVNGAMLYDRGALRPLFMLSIGQPGSSFAIEIAHQIGLPDDIIRDAKQLVGENNILYDKHLQDIARDKRYWADKRKQVHDKEKELTELTNRYEAEMADIKHKRKEVLLRAKEEAAGILRESNKAIENTIREIKESAADKERTKQARERVERLKERYAPEEQTVKEKKPRPAVTTPTEVEVNTLEKGARCRIRGQQAVGEILEISGKQAVVAFGNLKSTVPLKKLEYVSHRQAKKAETHSALTAGFYSNISESMRQRKASFRHEIDLRGFRADDALQEVMNFIDDAVMVGASNVTILHGTGTGVLKQVIRDYLKSQRKVQSFHDGDPDKGGAGLTVVEL